MEGVQLRSVRRELRVQLAHCVALGAALLDPVKRHTFELLGVRRVVIRFVGDHFEAVNAPLEIVVEFLVCGHFARNPANVCAARAGDEGEAGAQKLEHAQRGVQCEHCHRRRQQEHREAEDEEQPEHRLHQVQLRERGLRIACDARAEAVATATALDAASQPRQRLLARKRLRAFWHVLCAHSFILAHADEAQLAQLLLGAPDL
eukprot:scaffold40234_cov68-Phaeocystis_antarctica.AAC.10